MTASTPCRSASACHSATGCAPAYRTARAASWSSSETGNVTTPIRTPEGYPLYAPGADDPHPLAPAAHPLAALVRQDPAPVGGFGRLTAAQNRQRVGFSAI